MKNIALIGLISAFALTVGCSSTQPSGSGAGVLPTPSDDYSKYDSSARSLPDTGDDYSAYAKDEEAEEEPIARGSEGWKAKTVEDYEWLWEQMQAEGADRISLLIDFGMNNLDNIKDGPPSLYRKFIRIKALLSHLTLAESSYKPAEKAYIISELITETSNARALGTSPGEDPEVQLSLTDSFCKAMARMTALLGTNDELSTKEALESLLENHQFDVCGPYMYGPWMYQVALYDKELDAMKIMNEMLRYVERTQDGDSSKKAVKLVLEALLTNWDSEPQTALSKYEKAKALPVSDNDPWAPNAHEFAVQRFKAFVPILQEQVERNACRETLRSSTQTWAVRGRGVDGVVRLYNRYVDGQNETEPEYSGSGDNKYISAYRVSPELYRLEPEIKQWRDQYGSYSSGVFAALNQTVDYLESALKLRIEGYFVKKKDYRGEFERATAQFNMANDKLKEAREIYRSTSDNKCVGLLMDDD